MQVVKREKCHGLGIVPEDSGSTFHCCPIFLCSASLAADEGHPLRYASGGLTVPVYVIDAEAESRCSAEHWNHSIMNCGNILTAHTHAGTHVHLHTHTQPLYRPLLLHYPGGSPLCNFICKNLQRGLHSRPLPLFTGLPRERGRSGLGALHRQHV